ncbi:MAG: glycosyltransferase [Paenibacillaceae bacterium]
MALTRKRSPKKGRNRRPVQLSAYQLGHIAGFQRGKEDGFQQGRADAVQARDSIPTSSKQQLVALVITAGIIPSLDIGIAQPFNELNKRGNFSFEIRTEDDVSKEIIAQAHTIVFLRNVEPAAYIYLEWAHELGKRTVYVIDDNFLEIEPITPVGVYYADPIRRETFIKFLRNSHIVKVDSSILGDYIQERFNRKVVYFPGSVDFDWLDQQEQREAETGQIVIGYEGGSKEEDFAVVVPALKRILNYYGGFVRLEFFGFVPAALANHSAVKFEECGMDYRSFIRKLNDSQWDIGLAPLEDHTFNNTKTNNKLREYSACRIAGIYSNTPVYEPWVTQGETGYLVPHTEKGWYEGIVAMIENPTMRRQIKDQAESAARQNFSLTTCLDNWNTLILNT